MMNKLELDKILKTIYEGSSFKFKYDGLTYEFYCWYYNIKVSEYSYSIRSSFQAMNVSKITDKYIHLYTFDMMNQRTSFKLPISEIKKIDEK